MISNGLRTEANTPMIAIHPLGATLAVRAQPGAKKSGILGVHGAALKVAVTAPPEDGRANAALIELLHEWLGVRRSQVELLSGAANRNKVFLIRDISEGTLSELVAEHLH